MHTSLHVGSLRRVGSDPAIGTSTGSRGTQSRNSSVSTWPSWFLSLAHSSRSADQPQIPSDSHDMKNGLTQGKILTGNHRCSNEIWDFPVIFPVSQSIETCLGISNDIVQLPQLSLLAPHHRSTSHHLNCANRFGLAWRNPETVPLMSLSVSPCLSSVCASFPI